MMPRTVFAYCSVVGLLGCTLGGLRTLETPNYGALAIPLSSIPSELAGWHTTRSEQLTARQLELLRPTDYIGRAYQKHGAEAGVFIAYYAAQRAGEAMHSPRNCLPGEGWTISKHSRLGVPFKGGSAGINWLVIENSGRKENALYWYQSPNRVIANEYYGKFMLIRDAIIERRTDAALVRILLPQSLALGDEVLEFAGALMTQVETCFNRVPSFEM